MRGLMADPSGKIIPLPIRSNLREGHSVLEYFISTHGARKGLADTALRTADSGYLTRRLIDVAQDIIVREEDCGTTDYITMEAVKDGAEVKVPLAERIAGKIAAENIKHPVTKEILVKAGEEIQDDVANEIMKSGIESVAIRSVLTCKTWHGVCSKCYGRNLATNSLVEIGETVGIIAAQSIGEPGTQLTLRTFHYGGLAVEDIISGLPRVEELFEARKPKNHAFLSEIEGIVLISEEKDARKISVRSTSGEERVYIVPLGTRLKVRQGDHIEAGTKLTEGPLNPHDVLRIQGVTAVYKYLVNEVQTVYRDQGVDISDKHVEVIVRQMLRKVKVEEAGDTDLLPGSLVDNYVFYEENEKAISAGKKPATARPVLLGVTKASLATDSFLSAASFQETTKVLTEAAINGKVDSLLGLKENVIIGKLIPAGTGMARYREVEIMMSKEEEERLKEKEKLAEEMKALEARTAEETAVREEEEARKLITAWTEEKKTEAVRARDERVFEELPEEEEEVEVIEEIIEEIVEEVEEGELLPGEEYEVREEIIELQPEEEMEMPAAPLPEKPTKKGKEEKKKKGKKIDVEGKRMEKPKKVKEKKVALRLREQEEELEWEE